MNVLDLFSGIGGFSLGLERSGAFRTTAFCEIEPYCWRVLSRHWPGVKIYDDVRSLSAARLAADGIAVDVIAGGFPCQDISIAGRNAGIDGERSGLWRDMARLIGEIRPRYAIVENVPALLSRGLGRVLGDLAEIGFDAEWHCIPAAAIGAPHRRDRIWIVAHGGAVVANASEHRLEGTLRREVLGSPTGTLQPPLRRYADWWSAEPDVGRVADGVPSRVDRLRCLGNAIVPQLAELIGRAILAREAGR